MAPAAPAPGRRPIWGAASSGSSGSASALPSPSASASAPTPCGGNRDAGGGGQIREARAVSGGFAVVGRREGSERAGRGANLGPDAVPDERASVLDALLQGLLPRVLVLVVRVRGALLPKVSRRHRARCPRRAREWRQRQAPEAEIDEARPPASITSTDVGCVCQAAINENHEFIGSRPVASRRVGGALRARPRTLAHARGLSRVRPTSAPPPYSRAPSVRRAPPRHDVHRRRRARIGTPSPTPSPPPRRRGRRVERGHLRAPLRHGRHPLRHRSDPPRGVR